LELEGEVCKCGDGETELGTVLNKALGDSNCEVFALLNAIFGERLKATGELWMLRKEVGLNNNGPEAGEKMEEGVNNPCVAEGDTDKRLLCDGDVLNAPKCSGEEADKGGILEPPVPLKGVIITPCDGDGVVMLCDDVVLIRGHCFAR